MKLIHISDLHLGKRINEFSMLEDQRYILEQVCFDHSGCLFFRKPSIPDAETETSEYGNYKK